MNNLQFEGAEGILQEAAAIHYETEQSLIEKEIAHGNDVVRWVRILEENPSTELLLAALTHDIERIVNAKDYKSFKGDRNSPEYIQYKKVHAMKSANYVGERLMEMGAPAVFIIRVMLLIGHHDHPLEEVLVKNDPELETLVAADSFSFFTSIAVDMIKKEGVDRVKQKIRFMVAKMPMRFKQILAQQDFRDPVFGIDERYSFGIEHLKSEVLAEFLPSTR